MFHTNQKTIHLFFSVCFGDFFVCVSLCECASGGCVLLFGVVLGLFFCQCIMSCLKDWILGHVCKKEVASGSQRKLETMKFLSRVWPKDFLNTSLYNVNCKGWFFPHFLTSHCSVSLHHIKEPFLVLHCSMELHIGCPSWKTKVFTQQSSHEKRICWFLCRVGLVASSPLIYMCCIQKILPGEWEVNSDHPDTPSFFSDWIPSSTGGKELALKFSRLFLHLNWWFGFWFGA